MEIKQYICAKCGSKDTFKEKIMGSDTGDRRCSKCNYIGHSKRFLKNINMEK
jgi:DNA-directed RNA polymerase subunit RPC12/RpoP